jgi:hypothetical protein
MYKIYYHTLSPIVWVHLLTGRWLNSPTSPVGGEVRQVGRPFVGRRDGRRAGGTRQEGAKETDEMRRHKPQAKKKKKKVIKKCPTVGIEPRGKSFGSH